MSVLTLEGYVEESGAIRLLHPVDLPVNTRIYIVVPEYKIEMVQEITLAPYPKVHSPQLANPSQITDFVMEVSADDAPL